MSIDDHPPTKAEEAFFESASVLKCEGCKQEDDLYDLDGDVFCRNCGIEAMQDSIDYEEQVKQDYWRDKV